MDLPSLPRQMNTSVTDHEVLLSFNGDDGASAFVEWWETKGEKAFLAYLTKQAAK